MHLPRLLRKTARSNKKQTLRFIQNFLYNLTNFCFPLLGNIRASRRYFLYASINMREPLYQRAAGLLVGVIREERDTLVCHRHSATPTEKNEKNRDIGRNAKDRPDAWTAIFRLSGHLICPILGAWLPATSGNAGIGFVCDLQSWINNPFLPTWPIGAVCITVWM